MNDKTTQDISNPATEKALVCCFSELQSHAFESVPGGFFTTGRFVAEALNACDGKSVVEFTQCLRDQWRTEENKPVFCEIDVLDPSAAVCYVVEFKPDGKTMVGVFQHQEKPVDDWDGDEFRWKVFRNMMLHPNIEAEHLARIAAFKAQAAAKEAAAKADAKPAREAKAKAKADKAAGKNAAPAPIPPIVNSMAEVAKALIAKAAAKASEKHGGEKHAAT